MADRAGVVPQLLGAAVGIVLGATLLFALLGVLRDGGEASPEVIAAPSPSAAVEEPSDEPSEDAAEQPSEEATGEPTEEPSPEPVEEPTEEPSPEATATEVATEVDPGEISIQVLDAVGGEEGAAAARAVADELREAGYNVVVVNRAGRSYDVTTVFWSAGQETGGRQVAAALGTSAAEETPDEVQLSDSVDVHVVVGADRT